jgi:hypothetical protein
MQQPSIYYDIPYQLQSGAIQLQTCTCPSFALTNDRCKHIFLVQRYIRTMKVSPSSQRTEAASDDETRGNGVPTSVTDLRTTPSGSEKDATTLDSAPRDDASTIAQTLRLDHAERSVDFGRPDDMPVAMPVIQCDLGVVDDNAECVRINHDDADDAAPLTRERMPSYSPPPLYATEAEERYRAKGRALQAEFHEVVKGLYNLTVNNRTLADRHDQQRMGNMIAELRTMIPTWQEAIGQRGAGAAQSRY